MRAEVGQSDRAQSDSAQTIASPSGSYPGDVLDRIQRLGVACALGLMLVACASVPPPSTSVVPAGPTDLLGRVQKIQISEDDTLIDLARQHDLGYLELVTANPGVDPWLPGAREVLLPTSFVLPSGKRQGVVINLASMRLFLFREGEPPRSFPIGVSRDGWQTPLGETKVVRKKEGPTWYPGTTARVDYADLGPVVPPGPDNPLGTHAIYLGWPAILIHGTNEPYGIGRRVSRGCIRLYPEDIVQLYPLVDKGMPVRVINEPILIGWLDGQLYLEAHLTMDQSGELEENDTYQPVAAPKDLRERVLAAAGSAADRLDWDRVDMAVRERMGVPVRITRLPPRPAPPTVFEAIRAWFRGPALSVTPRAETTPTRPSARVPATEEEDGADVSAATEGRARGTGSVAATRR